MPFSPAHVFAQAIMFGCGWACLIYASTAYRYGWPIGTFYSRGRSRAEIVGLVAMVGAIALSGGQWPWNFLVSAAAVALLGLVLVLLLLSLAKMATQIIAPIGIVVGLVASFFVR